MMKCPKCSEKMESTNASGVQTYTCLYCSGIWVSEKALTILLKLENNNKNPRSFFVSKENQTCTKKNCPNCQDKFLYAFNLQNIEIDYCQSCYGIFFDENEIQSILPTKYKPEKNYAGLLVLDIVLNLIFVGLS